MLDEQKEEQVNSFFKMDQLSTKLIINFIEENFDISTDERKSMEAYLKSHDIVLKQQNADAQPPTTELEDLLKRSRNAHNRIIETVDEYTKRGNIDYANRFIQINSKPHNTELDTLKALVYFKVLSLGAYGDGSINPETDLHKSMAKTLTKLVIHSYLEKEGNQVEFKDKLRKPTTTILIDNDIDTIMYALTPDNTDLEVLKNWFFGDHKKICDIIDTGKHYKQEAVERAGTSLFNKNEFAKKYRKVFFLEPIDFVERYETVKAEGVETDELKRLRRMVIYELNNGTIGELHFMVNPRHPKRGYSNVSFRKHSDVRPEEK